MPHLKDTEREEFCCFNTPGQSRVGLLCKEKGGTEHARDSVLGGRENRASYHSFSHLFNNINFVLSVRLCAKCTKWHRLCAKCTRMLGSRNEHSSSCLPGNNSLVRRGN